MEGASSLDAEPLALSTLRPLLCFVTLKALFLGVVGDRKTLVQGHSGAATISPICDFLFKRSTKSPFFNKKSSIRKAL